MIATPLKTEYFELLLIIIVARFNSNNRYDNCVRNRKLLILL